MGSCVSSAHRNSESAMKLGLSVGSKSNNHVIPSSAFKENEVALKSQLASVPYGSKEETFFDSQPWLDSDCEDDFLSVNGDFTPSRGNTPMHQTTSTGTPSNRTPFEDRVPGSIPEPFPTDKKKKLAELFRESIRDDDQNISLNKTIANGKMGAKPTILDLTMRSSYSTPYVSGTNSVCSSERTPNGDFITEKEKPMKSVQCCLPSLISCRSFSERKKKMSPAVAVNDKPRLSCL